MTCISSTVRNIHTNVTRFPEFLELYSHQINVTTIGTQFLESVAFLHRMLVGYITISQYPDLVTLSEHPVAYNYLVS